MALDLWPAPVAPGPVRATVTVPGSKSVTNRALVLAAIADAPSRLVRPLRARDTLLMAGALRSMGVQIADDADDWVVTPRPLRGGATVDCGLAGTVMRFVPPVAALAHGPVVFDGDRAARERPMGPVLGALRTLGVSIDDGGRGGLPFTVHGAGAVAGGPVVLDASGSSQFVSALLLAGARYTRGVQVRHQGPPVPSLPHVTMTTAMLAERGVAVEYRSPSTWAVEPGPVRSLDTTIEPDLSNAAPFLAAALVTGGRVQVPGWPARSTQAGDALRIVLERLGGRCRLDERGLTVEGRGRTSGADLDLRAVGELTPVLAALAVLADSPSRLRGIAHLRGHETDRLAALARELTALGSDVVETPDGLAVDPRPLHGGRFRTYGDHRMGQAAAVLGLAVPGILVEDVATTGKSLPDFVGMWAAMLAGDAAA